MIVANQGDSLLAYDLLTGSYSVVPTLGSEVADRLQSGRCRRIAVQEPDGFPSHLQPTPAIAAINQAPV